MQTKIIERYFFFGLLLSVFIFTFFIFRPFWIVILLSISLSIIFLPLYNLLREKLSPNLASLFTVIAFIIILLGPVLAIGILVFNQTQDAYLFITTGGKLGPFIDNLEHTINKSLPGNMSIDLNQKISESIGFLTNNVAKIFSTTLSAFFDFTLVVLSMFYFLRDGRKWKKAIIELSPLNDKDDGQIISKIKNAVNGILKGYLFISLLQGILLGLGLYFVGIPNAALWGLVAGIASLLPMVGTSIISVPAIIYLFFTGHNIEGVILLAWSMLLVGTIDNLLSPYLISGKINIPPLLVLFAVLGGVSLLGPIGVLIGPLVISILYTLISIYKNEFENK